MDNGDVVISGCTILTMKEQAPIENGVILIKDKRLAFVGKPKSARHFWAETKIDGRGKIALPGLINCHTHAAMTLFRGLADDKPISNWLKRTIWPLEAKLSSKDVRVGASLACLEMIKSGTTCFADMYFHENKVAEAVAESGLRAVLAEGVIETGNDVLDEHTLQKSVDFVERYNCAADGRISTMLAPHAAYSCHPELLQAVIEKATELEVGIHTHLAESKTLYKETGRRVGLGEITFLHKLGFFGGHVVAAHCVDVSKSEMKILSKCGVNVAYVPVSNMKLGLGAARISEFADLGINVCLGTDGPASNNSLDMFETMKVGVLLQRLAYRDPSCLSAYKVMKMAMTNGAKALMLERDLGLLEAGKKADLILVDSVSPHLRPLHNFYSSLIYSGHGSDVDTVIVDGRVLMENRKVRTLDEKLVMEEAEKAALDLASR